MKLLDCLGSYHNKTIAIAGLNKNAGKTVVLNRFLNEAENSGLTTAITSIGYDGEKIDMLGGHSKPQIYVTAGTVVATASTVIDKANQDIEVISSTGQFTPLGEVYVVRYRQSGYAEIVGPSSLSGLIHVRNLMASISDLVIIDGALNRVTQISPKLCDAALLAVGGQGSIEEIVHKTKQQLNVINLPLLSLKVRDIFRDILNQNQSAIATKDGEYQILSIQQIVNTNVEQKEKLVVFQGALTYAIAKKLATYYKGVVISDPSTIFIDFQQLQALIHKGFSIQIAWELPLVAITFNPTNIPNKVLNIVQLGQRLSALCPTLPIVDVDSSLYFQGGELVGRLG